MKKPTSETKYRPKQTKPCSCIYNTHTRTLSHGVQASVCCFTHMQFSLLNAQRRQRYTTNCLKHQWNFQWKSHAADFDVTMFQNNNWCLNDIWWAALLMTLLDILSSIWGFFFLIRLYESYLNALNWTL